MKNYLYYWECEDRTDQKTIVFTSFKELTEKLKERNIWIHDEKRFEMEMIKSKTFYAFPSNVNGNFGLEWYVNLNFARSAQKELNKHLTRKFQQNIR
jgi:hypothetical protein